MKSASEVYNEGYVAGYNQHSVDIKEMTQEEADRILRKIRKSKQEEEE